MRIKKEYLGLIITKKHFVLGDITLDTNVIKPENYNNFIKLNCGFEEIFENEEPPKLITEEKPKKGKK